MDKVDIARTAQSRIAHLGVPDSAMWLPNMVKQVPTAMQTVAQQIASSPERNALGASFTITLTATGDTSSGSLLTAITADEPIILVPPFISVREATGNEYKFCDDRNSLDAQTLGENGRFYCLVGRNLIARATTPPTTLVIVASYVPSPTNFPNQFKDNVVNQLVALVLTSKN
jgi:hypothetical protein